MGRVSFEKALTAFAFIFLSTLSSKSYADVDKPLRILTWWGYFEKGDKKIQQIEESCGRKISIDEFYSNSEFLSRIDDAKKSETHYEIIVYSDTVSKVVQSRFSRGFSHSIEMKNISKNWHPAIRDFFKTRKFSQLTRPFQFSLTGFLVNKERINFSAKDSLSEIIKKLHDSKLVLVDDYVEVATLFRKWKCESNRSSCKNISGDFFPKDESLSTLFKQTEVIVTSDLGSLDSHPQFGAAYTWSGDAFKRSLEKKNLSFHLHPKLSHSSMDLISLNSRSKEARCVYDALSSKEFLNSVSKKSMYFSPFGVVKTKSSEFDGLQDQFFKSFPSLGRIHRFSEAEAAVVNKKWRMFKLKQGSRP